MNLDNILFPVFFSNFFFASILVSKHTHFSQISQFFVSFFFIFLFLLIFFPYFIVISNPFLYLFCQLFPLVRFVTLTKNLIIYQFPLIHSIPFISVHLEFDAINHFISQQSFFFRCSCILFNYCRSSLLLHFISKWFRCDVFV